MCHYFLKSLQKIITYFYLNAAKEVLNTINKNKTNTNVFKSANQKKHVTIFETELLPLHKVPDIVYS